VNEFNSKTDKDIDDYFNKAEQKANEIISKIYATIDNPKPKKPQKPQKPSKIA